MVSVPAFLNENRSRLSGRSSCSANVGTLMFRATSSAAKLNRALSFAIRAASAKARRAAPVWRADSMRTRSGALRARNLVEQIEHVRRLH